MTESTRGGARARAALVAGLLAALVGASTAAPVQAAPADPDVFCDVPGQELAIAPISGLSDGQAVTWRSTVKGVTPTTFTGEYIGKLDNGLGYDASGNPRDLLLVKLEGDVVDGTAGSPAAGVWAGASGSPVYDADGALIGAVAYGFSSLADNVAGVTPAAYMKSIGDLPLSQPLSPSALRQVASAVGETPKSLGGTTMRQLQPVRVTLGTTAAALDAQSRRLARDVPGYRPASMGGLVIDGGVDDGADYPIVAGGNIAVSFGYGAVGSASVGTVTAVCGDDVFAFGHPNEWNSSLSANIHGASAARIVPDLGSSYKLVGAIGKVKGKLVEDRLAGVRGTLGAGTPTIPVTTTTAAGSQRGTAVSHISEKLLLAPAAAAQLSADALRLLDNAWEGSALVTWTISYVRESGATGTLRNTNRYSSTESFSEFVGWDLADDIAALQTNPFEDVQITGVKIGARFTDGYRAAKLSGVQMLTGGTWKNISRNSMSTVPAGKTYTFRAVLTPVPGAKRVTEYATFTAAVPRNARPVVVSLSVPRATYDYDEEATSFPGLVRALDANHRVDVITRERSYTTTSGKRYRGTGQTIAQTVLVPGSSFVFTLKPAK